MAQMQVEQLLSGFLKTSNATEEDQLIAYLMAETEAQQMALCRYLADNPEASGAEILAAARRIATL